MASASLFPGLNDAPALTLDYCGVLRYSKLPHTTPAETSDHLIDASGELPIPANFCEEIRAWESMGGEIDPLDKITLENVDNTVVPQMEMPSMDFLSEDPYLLPGEQMLGDSSLDLMTLPMDMQMEPIQYTNTQGLKEEPNIVNTGATSDTHSAASSFLSDMIPSLDPPYLGQSSVSSTHTNPAGVVADSMSSLTNPSLGGVDSPFTDEKPFSSLSDLGSLPLVGGPSPFPSGPACDPISIPTIDSPFQLGSESHFGSPSDPAGCFSSGSICPSTNPPAFLSGPSLPPGSAPTSGFNPAVSNYSSTSMPVPAFSAPAPVSSFVHQSSSVAQQSTGMQQQQTPAQPYNPPSSRPYNSGKATNRSQSRKQMSFAAQVNAVNGVKGEFRTRQQCLERYLEKKARRLQTKKIRYELRKINADRRPRIKGRFVKKEQLEEYLRNQKQAKVKVEC